MMAVKTSSPVIIVRLMTTILHLREYDQQHNSKAHEAMIR